MDLRDQAAVAGWMADQRPHAVFLAAARVGGIQANATYPADFLHDNLAIQSNVIGAAVACGVEKLLFLGSSCIYPKLAPQPITEEALLTGPLEPTNEPYAIAKIAGIKLCESYNRQYGHDYRSIMPTNLYGPGDNYHPENSHVIPALMRRIHEAKESGADEVVIWGSGTPRREFLHVDDLAEAAVHFMGLEAAAFARETAPMRSHLNIGSGEDVSIRELADTLCRVIGYTGRLAFDSSKPDGTPRKLLDVSRANRLGWRARIDLEHGLATTYRSSFLAGAALRAG